MRARHYAFTPETGASNSIATSQSLAGAGNVALNGNYGANGFGYSATYSKSNLRPQWNITVTSSANISGVTLTFTYLDAQLNEQTASVAGPNTTTIDAGFEATQILSVAASGAVSNISIGHTTVGHGPWKSLPARRGFQGSTISIGIAGTANYTIEETFANITDNDTFTGTFDHFEHPTIANKTVSAYGDLGPRTIGYRLRINSWTDGEIRVDNAVAMVG